MSRIPAFIIFLVILSACALPGLTTNTEDTQEPITPSTTTPEVPPTESSPTYTPPMPSSIPSSDPSNTAPVETTLTRYTLQAELDYWMHTVAVSQTIEYTNNSPEAINDLRLEVEANRWTGGFNLTSLKWAGGEEITNFQLDSNHLSIPLPQPLQPSENLSLYLKYNLILPAIPPLSDTTRPVPYGYTELQTNLVDWYPSVPPWQVGEGWLLHEPWYLGEHQVYEVANYDVQISLSEPVKDLIIAASAPTEKTGDVHYFHLEVARNFVWSASHVYQVNSSKVDDITVTSYAFPSDTRASEQALQDTAQALKLYSDLFSPYPFNSLSVVEADFLDGMEFSGLYFLSRSFYNPYDGTPQGYLTAIAAHETAHQWWYNQVGNDQAIEPWLDEALCTYTERIFLENIYPEVLDWWWAYRVDYYKPSGFIDGAIYDYATFRAYRDSVYLNGVNFLEELRQLIGDQAFFSFLHGYAIKKSAQQSTAEDFFGILHEYTTEDLDPLRMKYFSSKGSR